MDLKGYLKGSIDQGEDLILSNILAGLEFLHNHNVIYRVLKPSNGTCVYERSNA